MHLSLWILSPLVWFFLPGYALTPDRPVTGLRLLPMIGLSFLLTCALSLTLTFFGAFNARLITMLLLLFLPFAAYRYWRLIKTCRKNWILVGYKIHAVLILIFAMCLMTVVARSLSERQPEKGACDSGVYLVASSHLTRSGSFDWNMDALLPADPSARNLSLRTTPYQFPWQETWPGIVKVREKFAPQFFPLYPIWLSLFRSALGGHSYYYLNMWSLFLSLVFLVFLCRSYFSLHFAWPPMVVLILNPGLIYFWDYPLAEIFLSFIFTAMLVFLVYGLRYRIWSFLVISACFLSAGMATKYMAWFLLAPLALVWILSDKKAFLAKYFGLPLMLAAVFPVLCLALWNYPHFLNHFLPRERLVQATAFGLGLIFLWVLSRIAKVRRHAPWIVGVLFTLAVMGFLMILPHASERGEENVLPELAWYTGWGWLALAFIGCWGLLFRKGKDAKTVLVFFLLMLGVAFAGTADNPLHPFAFRRHIPVLLPLLALLSTVALHWLRRLGWIVLSGVVLLCAVPPIVTGAGLMTAPEGRGFLPLLNRVVKELPEGPVFGLDDADWLASQAQLLAQKAVYPMHMESAVGLEVYQAFAGGGGSVKVLTGQLLPYDRIRDWTGAIEQLRPERNLRPSVIETDPVKLFLYTVPLERTRAADRIVVGGDDFGRVAGFWLPEQDKEHPFRWSRQWCHFVLKAGDRVSLTMNSAGHPENPVPFRLYVGNELIAEDYATPGWKDYTVVLPPHNRHRISTFSLVTHTFQPLPDTRDLGLMVSKIIDK